jgi:hypothetical protein
MEPSVPEISLMKPIPATPSSLTTPSSPAQDLDSLSPEERWPDCSPEGRIVVAGLHRMSDEELLAIAVRAGVSTPDGQLTANYRHDAEPSICRPTD